MDVVLNMQFMFHAPHFTSYRCYPFKLLWEEEPVPAAAAAGRTAAAAAATGKTAAAVVDIQGEDDGALDSLHVPLLGDDERSDDADDSSRLSGSYC